MAIKISNLNAISEQYKQKDYYYKDLHLDFEVSNHYSPALEASVYKNDIVVSYDENAIKNSLKNLFNTKPGQRFLFPLYGLDLNQYLFEAVTEDLGQIIGERIVTAIGDFEPRVIVQSCNVIAVPDDNLYEITLVVEIPIFNSVASINSILDTKQQSFIFVETTRTI